MPADKVFVVSVGIYDDHHVAGVFSSQELADKFVVDCRAYPPGVEIEEFTVDVVEQEVLSAHR